MNRDQSLQRLADNSEQWDVLVIGGGATGLGTAVDAARIAAEDLSESDVVRAPTRVTSDWGW